MQCNGNEINIWRNGILVDTKDLPEGVTWYIKDTMRTYSLLNIGENGWVLLSNYEFGIDTDSIKSFVLYNSKDDTWLQIEDCAHGSCERSIIVGNCKKYLLYMIKI